MAESKHSKFVRGWLGFTHEYWWSSTILDVVPELVFVLKSNLITLLCIGGHCGIDGTQEMEEPGMPEKVCIQFRIRNTINTVRFLGRGVATCSYFSSEPAEVFSSVDNDSGGNTV